MFLEWWMIAILGGVFVAGMQSCYRDGVQTGRKIEVESAIDVFVQVLQRAQILDIEKKDGEIFILPKKLLTSPSENVMIDYQMKEGESNEQSRTMGDGNAGRRDLHDS